MTKKTTIKAGGGLVVNPEGQILMIFRRGYWDLPKGKIEPRESIEECALREVREECGITNLVVERFLCVTTHDYQENGVPLVKESHWFLMRGSGEPTAQVEEDITEARWVAPEDVSILLENSYPSIRSVMQSYTQG